MIEVTVTERGPTPKLMLRQLNDVARAVAAELGDYWHRNYLPKHFTHAGATEYGYAKRNRRYEMRKLKTEGHTYPLVGPRNRKGELHSKDMMRIRDIRATAKKGEAKVRVVLHMPHLNYRPAGGRIDMRQEITTVSQREADQLAILAGQVQEREYMAINVSTNTKVG